MLVSSEDLSRACNSQHASVLRLIKKHNIEPVEVQRVPTGGMTKSVPLVTKEDASYLLSHTRYATPESLAWLSDKYNFKFGDPVNRKLVIREETRLLHAIKLLGERYSDGEFRIEQQYSMFGYNVDIAVITSFSILCIEHDGPEHKYKHKEDTLRERDIAKQYIASFKSEQQDIASVVFYRCLQGAEMECVARVSNLMNSDSFKPGACYAPTSMIGFREYHQDFFWEEKQMLKAQDSIIATLCPDPTIEESDEDW